MPAIEFRIPGTPVAKQSGQMGNGRLFTKPKSRNYQALVVECAAKVAPSVPIEGPVVLTIEALFPRTKELLFRYKGGLYKYGPWRVPFAQRPDFDNVSKPICDGITQAGVWLDDKQVVDARVTMHYCAIGETPGALITIESYEG